MPNKNRYQLAKILANKNANAEESSSSNDSPDINQQEYSREEVLSDYLNFLRSMPPLIESEKDKIINCVKGSL